ncbi:hypothetical protein [Paenibacillus whitsoniae]|uniref:Uncharacterized protein n=1 Tax=Paenibacillus whitsoniae TaxID=2496558 RepID=A0A3S0A1E2_9BACL|nr:hypothetical protein [Paenibacillus whitsoniae]RTE06275.1 hypothetical protein EJQ19_23160 [Paenibacillus whitsoniae]
MGKNPKQTIDDDAGPHPPGPQPARGGKSSDLFGFGKLIDKLPLHKLSARMAYCLFFNLILLLFVLVLRATNAKINEFPNAWDLRAIVLVTVIVFFVGLCDLWKWGKP